MYERRKNVCDLLFSTVVSNHPPVIGRGTVDMCQPKELRVNSVAFLRETYISKGLIGNSRCYLKSFDL